VTGDEPVQADKVGRWMRQQGLTVALPLEVRPIGDGLSNLTYLATDIQGRSWVLRRPPTGPLLRSAHDVTREFRILNALQATKARVPRVYALTTDTRVCDAPLMVMERVDGLTLPNRDAAAALDEDGRRRCGFSLIETLAEIHATDLTRTGLDSLASHAPYAERQLRRWLTQAKAGPDATPVGMLEMGHRLLARAPAQQEVTLVHADCHLGNVVVDRDGHVSALLDWELATLGDPIADLGTALAYWPQPDDALPPGPYPQSSLPGFAPRAELAAHYAAVSGRSIESVYYWQAFAAWRIAVIFKGVRERRHASPAPLGTPARPNEDPELIQVMLARADSAGITAGL
jgi:aminoglycoside phosphotransferase (APT) family kinase protein